MARIITHPGYLDGLDDVKALDASAIALEADLPRPDMGEGSEFLLALRDALVETLGYEDDPVAWLTDGQDRAGDYALDAADTAVDSITATHHRWLTFVDLCAYDADIDDFLPENTPSLNDQCALALVAVGAQAVRAMVEMLRTSIRENEEDDPFPTFTVDRDASDYFTATCIDCGAQNWSHSLDRLAVWASAHAEGCQ